MNIFLYGQMLIVSSSLGGEEMYESQLLTS